MAGIIGGRALEVLSNPLYYPSWYDRVALWEGGFSALGSIIGVMIITPLFLRIKNIPILPLLDCAALYAPLFQAIARIGCLFSGCCHGTPTDSWLSITYTHYSTNAICNIAVHPTQLYSTILLFGIFLLLVLVIQPYTKKAGQLFCTYIALASLERFFVDFWRHDRIFIGDTFSFHQLIALILCSFSVCMLYIITYTRHPFSKISSL
jgi:phosphatidylglycerol:prolipoprotein diacylglycerol transferase